MDFLAPLSAWCPAYWMSSSILFGIERSGGATEGGFRLVLSVPQVYSLQPLSRQGPLMPEMQFHSGDSQLRSVPTIGGSTKRLTNLILVSEQRWLPPCSTGPHLVNPGI